MATVPSPRTWVAGEIVTASELNTNVRDPCNFFIARPMAVVRQTVAQSVSSSAWTSITFDTEDLDRDNMHSTSSNTSRLTVVTTGWYRLAATVPWSSNSTGTRAIAFATSGGTRYGKVQYTASSVPNCMHASVTAFANAAQYFEVQGFQSSGGSLNVNATETDGNPRFEAEWLSTA